MSHELFKVAMLFTLPSEKGKVDHPKDRGGATNDGITQKVYDKYRDSQFLPLRHVFEMTNEERDIIYFENYWISGGCEAFNNNKMAVCHFDACVNHGISGATKILQEAIGGLTIDGNFGSKTLTAVNNSGDISIRLLDVRRNYYTNIVKKNPDQAVFLKGWMNRADNLEKYIRTL